jgi:hypothetical protein
MLCHPQFFSITYFLVLIVQYSFKLPQEDEILEHLISLIFYPTAFFASPSNQLELNPA